MTPTSISKSDEPNMWDLQFTDPAKKAWRKLDHQRKRELGKALDNLRRLEDPRVRCKPLQHVLKGLWRIRVGDYRVVIDIRDDELILVIIDLGTRADVYINPNFRGQKT